ncbi:MAG: (2Fe-2S) ferredoxin domain-containing protein [Pirellulaceae bacterium]
MRERFKDEIKKRDLGPLVRANSAGCLDQCEYGPVVVIYPQQIWYGGVTLDDVSRIIEQTVLQGQIIPELVIPDQLLNTKGGRLLSENAPSDAASDKPE